VPSTALTLYTVWKQRRFDTNDVMLLMLYNEHSKQKT